MTVADLTPLIPALEGEAAQAVAHRGGHIQIIAAAGSGKTEVVSQRVASLLADGEDPHTIVAFTFTEKAASEMKERIRQRVSARLGAGATDKLGQLFVGTIHSFCFHLLQEYAPLYETYTPLDANQLTSFLYREANRLNLKTFDRADRVFSGIAAFQRSIAVIENELLSLGDLPDDDFKHVAEAYYETLDRYRFLSFGTQIVQAVKQLRDTEVHARVTSQLKHLIVDEYQDVNPAQEELIRLLAKGSGGGNADLAVVGDDDQAIYQWRGSAVGNIVHFNERYPNVTTFHLLKNRRSRPGIVQLANDFAHTIPGRLEKSMQEHREANGPAVAIAVDLADERTEAIQVARIIERLSKQGVPFRDMSILVRARTAYPKLLQALAQADIPVQPGGREGLFQKPEAAAFGKTYAWIANIDWRDGKFSPRAPVGIDSVLEDYQLAFGLSDITMLREHLEAWKQRCSRLSANPDLVGDFYKLVGLLGVKDWDLSDERQRLRLGTVARFTQVLADYETVFRRSRRDPATGEYRAGRPGDEWYYRQLAIMLVNYSIGAYDDFDGEHDPTADGVNLDTVHSAKGLEWPVVFLPSLTATRFPSSRTGTIQEWLLPRDSFDAIRYEGTDADERRLFYVALTRARDWVSLSSHARVESRGAQPSPYILEAQHWAQNTGLPTGAELKGHDDIPDLTVTYSELAAYIHCPQSYFLRTELGFMPPVAQEIGYGNAVHHVLRILAEQIKATGQPPTPKQVNDLIASDFYLPFANPTSYREMMEKARRIIFMYIEDHHEDLARTWAAERPFELYLPGLAISGRADVIFDEYDDRPDNLAIVDYKTSTMTGIEPLQLQVYTDAARREGLTVSAAFIHDLDTTERHIVEIDEAAVKAAEATVMTTATSLKKRDFTPKPETRKCARCDVRFVCGVALSKKQQ